MKEEVDKKIYCSLDIETTGFDPLKEEILEVGFAIFEVSNSGVKITEEWTQVFKPSKEVSPQILALTGITNSEIDVAPSFAEHREFLQQKLQDAIIVGHNISFDVKFLEAFGLKLSGGTIDTLDLVQWLLPTHHSYNLENLMHTFGISHKDAHRALADSKATLKLLEKLLQVFNALPNTLQSQIKNLISGQSFLWTDLLNYSLKPLSFADAKKANKKPAKFNKSKLSSLDLEDKIYYNFPIGQDFIQEVAEVSAINKRLLVVPKTQTVLELYKSGLVDAIEIQPEHVFDEKKFNKLLKKKNLQADTLKFLLKLLVWKATNWQTETILDLNLSFFGGQFKTLVTGSRVKVNKSAKLIACDMGTFLHLSSNSEYPKYHAIVCGLNEFESAVTSNISSKASWGYLNFLLKGFYNPEFSSLDNKYKDVVSDLFLASDLFFGLVSAMLKNEGETFQYVKINQALLSDERWNKICGASENLVKKLEDGNLIIDSLEIKNFAETLKQFFVAEDNRVKWIELGDSRCVFSSMPLDISELVSKALNQFVKVSLVDALDFEKLPKFFLNRLGLKDFKIEQLNFKNAAGKIKKQGDLFESVKNIFIKQKPINFHYLPELASEPELLKILKTQAPYPAAILFSSPIQVKEFYERNYETLKEEIAVLAQSSYGGSNKLLRNFSINPKSLMLVADKFILKNLNSNSATDPVTKVDLTTLVICRLPFDQFTHPYQEALSSTLANSFEDYALPRALYNFHSLIKFFLGPKLQNVYIIDQKLAKPYAQVFKDYWKVIPGARTE